MVEGLIFTANTTLARSLYVGCPQPLLPRHDYEHRLKLIIIGVQKGGSTSVNGLLHHRGLCRSATGELQFFNSPCFAARPVLHPERLMYLREWHGCHGNSRANRSGTARSGTARSWHRSGQPLCLCPWLSPGSDAHAPHSVPACHRATLRKAPMVFPVVRLR